MKIQEAIEKAIEGGWNYEKRHMTNLFGAPPIEVIAHELSRQGYLGWSLLDPAFWQSLGKSLGWSEKPLGTGTGPGANHSRGHLYHWHRLIDHLASGGTIETYFEGIQE